jgi:hypothetical protein
MKRIVTAPSQYKSLKSGLPNDFHSIQTAYNPNKIINETCFHKAENVGLLLESTSGVIAELPHYRALDAPSDLPNDRPT